MKPAAGPASNESGFSLIELILALAILSILAAFLLRAVDSSRMLLALAARSDGSEPLHVHQALRRLIAETRSAGKSSATAVPLPALRGSRDSLSFTSSYAPFGSPWGITEYRLEFVRSDLRTGSGMLSLAHRPAHSQAGADWSTLVLLRNVTHVTFRYVARGDTSGLHRSEWRAAERPALVEVDISHPAYPSRAWPTLRIGLPLTD